MTTRGETLMVARKLLRGFAGAPDVRRHAQTLYGGLARCEGWSPSEQELVLALGAWLQSRPSLHELKPRLEQFLARVK